jgi:hypothetical protein
VGSTLESGGGAVAPALSKRRWGYVVWGVALGFVFIPEILAAVPLTESQLPFPTISRMTGHLEYQHAQWELAPTMLIVFVLLSLLRAPIAETSGGNSRDVVFARWRRGDKSPHRTPGGRLTSAPVEQTAESFDKEGVRALFVVRSVLVAMVITGLTLWAVHHWPNQYDMKNGARHKLPNYPVAYILYASIGFFWLLLPGVTGFAKGKDAQFPNLFRTIQNLEQWIARPRRTEGAERLGHAVAWLLSFLLVWGMVFLMLHLTLYPFPNITHILNHGG